MHPIFRLVAAILPTVKIINVGPPASHDLDLMGVILHEIE